MNIVAIKLRQGMHQEIKPKLPHGLGILQAWYCLCWAASQISSYLQPLMVCSSNVVGLETSFRHANSINPQIVMALSVRFKMIHSQRVLSQGLSRRFLSVVVACLVLLSQLALAGRSIDYTLSFSSSFDLICVSLEAPANMPLCNICGPAATGTTMPTAPEESEAPWCTHGTANDGTGGNMCL